MRGATAQQMPISILGHPAGAGQVRGPDCLGAFCVMRWIEMQNDPRDLPPIRAFRIGIEKAQISDEMLLVVAGENIGRRSSIRYWRIELGWLHESALRG